MTALLLIATVLLQPLPDPNQFNNFLLLAYGALWVIAIVYILSLANKQRNLLQEIRLMRRLLKEDEGEDYP